MIDIHVHMGRLLHDHKEITAEHLIDWMNQNGIDKSVILPIVSPEDLEYMFTTEQTLEACSKYPDRLIPFCNVDPRCHSNDGNWDPKPIIKEYVDAGCKGLGEVLASLNTDDPRMKKIYKACGELGIPVLPEFRAGGCIALQDEIGMPRFENVLKEFPDTIFIAHGPAFWAEMSADVTEVNRDYLSGKVTSPGKVDYLLSNYSNIYGDLSAKSAYTALSRDTDYAKPFLERHAKQLLFGTDYFVYGMKTPIVGFIREIGLDKVTYDIITHDNAAKLLNV